MIEDNDEKIIIDIPIIRMPKGFPEIEALQRKIVNEISREFGLDEWMFLKSQKPKYPRNMGYVRIDPHESFFHKFHKNDDEAPE